MTNDWGWTLGKRLFATPAPASASVNPWCASYRSSSR